jgi:hypothetical protein
VILDRLLKLLWEWNFLGIDSDLVKVSWAFAILAEGGEIACLGDKQDIRFVSIATLLTDCAETALNSKDILGRYSRVLYLLL